jgi:hypothetical protein
MLRGTSSYVQEEKTENIRLFAMLNPDFGRMCLEFRLYDRFSAGTNGQMIAKAVINYK